MSPIFDISVVIPTRNRSKLLPRALKSVNNQTQKPLEIIVVDDGSTDDTVQMVRRDYPEVQYIYQDHRGVSAARNTGINAAKGEWLAFLDSDDEWLPEKLARQTHEISQSTGHRFCHTDEIWIRRGVRVNPMRKHRKYGGWIYERCLPLCVISPSSALIHRSVLDEVGIFDEKLPACEDYDLWLRICRIFPVLFLDKKLLLKYGGHSDQLSGKYWGMDRFRVCALEKILSGDLLSAEQREATLNELLRKLTILSKGARNRNNLEAAETITEKIAYYQRTRVELQAGAS